MRTTSSIDPGLDIIDSRDVIERIKDLEETEELDEDEEEELKLLKALEEEASSCGAWNDGELLIKDDYFEEYAQDFANDIGAIDPKLADRWPYNCINWKEAAEELQSDYFSVSFGDYVYWIRSC
jgi:hypothetical protein